MAVAISIGAFVAAGWCGAQTKGKPEGHAGKYAAGAFALVFVGMIALIKAL